MGIKIDESGGLAFTMKKNKNRKMQEPIKLEKNKIYPMITILNTDGEIHWSFLESCEKYVQILKNNFKINNSLEEIKQNLKITE